MSEDNTTQSHRLDVIRQYLNRPKHTKIIDSFIGNPNGTFLFEPPKDSEVAAVFLEDREDYPVMIKAIILEILKDRYDATLKGKSDEYFKNIKVKITDATNIKLNEWGPSLEGVPVAAECLVIAMDKRGTYTKRAIEVCSGCGKTNEVFCDNITKRLPKPDVCMNEKCRFYKQPMTYQPDSFVTSHIQRIMIQEPIDEAKHGSPIIFDCEIKDDDVGNVFIGQRKKIIGIFRSIPKMDRMNRLESMNMIVIQAISVIDVDDVNPILPSEDELVKYEKMSKEPDWIPFLVKSFAPEVHAESNSSEYLGKLSILIGLVGGTKVGRLRGDINVFLGGDPAVGKTQMLKSVQKITQKSAYVNGRMASGAGLTIGMDRMPDGRKFPRAGPIPLCTKGFVAIDEMGQLSRDDLSALHESMESQTITYTKGGFNVTLEAETTIIGGANPKGDRYDPDIGPTDNLNIRQTVLSRFDLKVNMRDIVNLIMDEAKIDHILKIRKNGISGKGILSERELMALLNHVRSIRPVMDEDAENHFKKFYHDLRSLAQPSGALPIDNRLFESLYRVATAFAKAHFSKKVTLEHAEMAIRLFKLTLKTWNMNTDKETLQMDMKESTTDKDKAAVHVWREMEKKKEDEWLHESDFITELTKEFPKLFPTEDDAQAQFNSMRKKERFLKQHGRFRLL